MTHTAIMLGFKLSIMANLDVRTRRVYPTDREQPLPTADPDMPPLATVHAVEQIVRTGQGREAELEYEHLLVHPQVVTTIQRWHADHYDRDDPATPPVWLDGSVIAHNLTGDKREPPRELQSAWDDLVCLRGADFVDEEGLEADVEAVKPPVVKNYDDAIQWAENSLLTRREAEAWFLTEDRGLDQHVAGACLGVSRSTIYSHCRSARDKHAAMRETDRFFDRFGRPD